MATFTAGTSFTDGVTGDVTASKLNALVANATPLANLITDRTAETSIATDDLVLISDTSESGALNKMTVANLMKAEMTGTINSTAGTIGTLNSTTGTIPTLVATTLVTTGTGTAAAPAIVPTGDTNTGVFFPAADTTAFSTQGTERLRITSGGKLQVGTSTNQGGKVDILIGTAGGQDDVGIVTKNAIDGNFAMQFKNSAGNSQGYIIVNASSVSYVSTSDYRLKTNLEPIINGIDRIKQLPVYRFNWIADESGNKVDGFVAHEAQAIVPECVTGEKDAVDADGNPVYQGIDQSKIVPLLTAALKEAIAKIETLETNNTALESRIAALEAA